MRSATKTAPRLQRCACKLAALTAPRCAANMRARAPQHQDCLTDGRLSLLSGCPPPSAGRPAQAARTAGYGGDSHADILAATRTPAGAVDFFVELHIEQGPLLEQVRRGRGSGPACWLRAPRPT